MNEQGLPTECWYCSDENVKGHIDRQFGVKVAWDIPILEGYSFRFYKNYSWRASIYNGFFGLINPGMIRDLFKEPRSIVVVHGWAYLTHVLIVVFARLAGHKVCLRGESPLKQELLKNKKTRLLKRIILQHVLFRFVHKFLYIGAQNKAFYQYYGVKDARLVFAPYAVNNEYFRKAAEQLLPHKVELRRQLGLPLQSHIILFAAKYIEKKRPLDILTAYQRFQDGNRNVCLVMVGEGKMREEMEDFIVQNNLSDVYLTGFINQGDIVKYYALADVFVLCSGTDETWGLSVNEAMNFDLPVVVSDMAGCSADLVKEGDNGFISKTGDSADLKNKIIDAIQLDGKGARTTLNTFSFKTIVDSFLSIQSGQGSD